MAAILNVGSDIALLFRPYIYGYMSNTSVTLHTSSPVVFLWPVYILTDV